MPINSGGDQSGGKKPKTRTVTVKAHTRQVPVKPAAKPQGPFGFLNKPSRQVAQAQQHARDKRAQQAAHGEDMHRGDAYKRSSEYAKTLALASLSKQGRFPKARDVTVSPDRSVVSVKHRRALLPDVVTELDAKTLLKGGIKLGDPGMQVDSIHAAGANILAQTTRPIHGIAGATDALVQGKGLSAAHHALTRGLQNKDHTLFSDVLKHAGAPGVVAAVGGFAGDTLADPTTYLTGGLSAVTRKAALKEAARVEVKAVKAGLDPAHAVRLGHIAAAKVAKAGAHKGRGIDVQLAGHSVPGVTRATAAAAKGAAAASRQLPKPVQKVGPIAKESVREVRPTIAPAGADAEQFVAARQVAREARASTSAGAATADRTARGLARRIAALQKQHGPDVSAHIIDAIERGRIKTLPADVRKQAIEIRDHYRYMKRLRSRAGIREGTIGQVARVTIPPVTISSETVQASARHLAKLKRARDKARRDFLAAQRGQAVSQGRAEVLSRNVGGVAAERDAQKASGYQAGGYGVSQGHAQIAKAENAAHRAEAALAHHRQAHSDLVVRAREQRVANQRAVALAASREGRAVGYFPHAREDALHARMGVVEDNTAAVPQSAAKRTGPTPEGSGRRSDTRPLNEASAARVARGESAFSTDIPLVTSNYTTSTARAVAENEAFKQVAALGRRYKPGDTLGPGEGVFHLGYSGKNSKFGLRPVADGEAKRSGQYVVLDEKTVEAVMKRIKPAQATTQAGRAFDRTTGAFKRIATFTPGFHIRNAIGDTQMAYLTQPGHVLPRNIGQAIKANRANVRLEKFQADHLHGIVPDSGKTIKVAGKRMSVEAFASMAEKLGVTQSGQIGRELVDLAQGAAGHTHVAGRAGRGVRKVLAPVERLTRGRENVIRLSTFKHGLDKGLSPREAADLSLKTHIDYGDLTDLERGALRRAMPFYTFSARAIPFHAEKLLTHPGKFAAYEKLIEEGAKAAGLGPDWQNNVDQFKQRQLGVPLKINGSVVLVSASLPMTTLNELPDGLHPVKYADEVGQLIGGLLNPVIKDPVELWSNYSFFFRSQIRNPDKPLVAAPRWVASLPAAEKAKLGVSSIIDPKTGKRVPAWDAKANYVSKAIPGPVALIQGLLTPGSNRRGQGTTSKVIGAVGVKVDDYDPAKVALNNAYTMVADLASQLGKMRQEGRAIGRDGYYTPAYQALLTKQRQVTKARDVLAQQGGKAAPVAGKSRPLSAADKVHKEIADFKKKSSPAATRSAVLKEIQAFKAAAGAP